MNNEIKKLLEKKENINLNIKFTKKERFLEEDFLKRLNNDSLIVEWFQYLEVFQVQWFVEKLNLYNSTELKDGQLGYAIDSHSGETISNWNKNWLVIGIASFDPIIYDIETKKIYSSVHGVGEWNLILISNSFSEFLTLLNIWIDIISDKNAIYNQYEEIDEVILTELKEMINELKLDKKLYDNFIKLDWFYSS